MNTVYGPPVTPDIKLNTQAMNAFDRICFKLSYVNKYPSTWGYRKLTTLVGLRAQIKEQGIKDSYNLSYLQEFDCSGKMLWEVHEAEISLADVKDSFMYNT